MKRRGLLTGSVFAMLVLQATTSARASSYCPGVTIGSFENIACIMRNAAAAADRAVATATTDAAKYESPRVVSRLHGALSGTSGLDDLIAAYAARGGHPHDLLGRLERLIERLLDASHIAALALVAQDTPDQFRAWEWTMQALQAAQALWRPVVECYIAVRGGHALPSVRPVPLCG